MHIPGFNPFFSAVLFIHHLITASPTLRRKHCVKKARAFPRFLVSCTSFRNKWSLVSHGGVLMYATQGPAAINQEENCPVMRSKAICRIGRVYGRRRTTGTIKISGAFCFDCFSFVFEVFYVLLENFSRLKVRFCF